MSAERNRELVREDQLTITDNLVAGLALDMTVANVSQLSPLH